MSYTERKIEERLEEPMISINVMDDTGRGDSEKKELLELQLKMATSSINHEYARIEFDDVEDADFEKREDLLNYMHDCRCQYFEARSELAARDPYALADFEADLMRQKQMTLAHYSA